MSMRNSTGSRWCARPLQVYVGQNAYLCTPAMSAVIRRRKLYGALIW